MAEEKERIEDTEEPMGVKVDPEALKAAVAEVLPELVKGAVEVQLKALSETLTAKVAEVKKTVNEQLKAILPKEIEGFKSTLEKELKKLLSKQITDEIKKLDLDKVVEGIMKENPDAVAVQQFYGGAAVHTSESLRVIPLPAAVERLEKEGITYIPEVSTTPTMSRYAPTKPAFTVVLTSGQLSIVTVAVENPHDKQLVWLREGEFTVSGLS